MTSSAVENTQPLKAWLRCRTGHIPLKLAHVSAAYAAPSPGARRALDVSQWPRVVFKLRAAGAAATRRVAADQRAESVRDMKGL